MAGCLLPSSKTQFQLKDYWEEFFLKRSTSFEWYGEYIDLCHVIHKYVKPQNRVLMVGCGNSKLSEGLYDAGFHQIDNIDISETVIKQMSAKNKSKRPVMTYKVMDVTMTTYDGDTFDVVMDKGTLDALCVDEGEESTRKVHMMFSEVKRVLRAGGRYICVSLSQEHVLNQLLMHHDKGWIIRAHIIRQSDRSQGLASHLPVFIFVMTKMMAIPGSPPIQIFEYVNEMDECVRCESVNDIKEFVKNHQQYAIIQHHLNCLHLDKQLTVDLWSKENSNEPRYTLRVVDIPRKKAINGLFAIFLVPQGRETGWLYSSENGCRELAESAGYERLIVVTFHRGHAYPGLDQVKDEVSTKAMELRQDGLPDGKKWPVLTVLEGMGERTVLKYDTSPSSGSFVIEETVDEGDRGMIRRLVFLDSPHLAQTEVLLKSKVHNSKSSKKNKSKRQKPSDKGSPGMIDHSQLMFDHHAVMISSLGLVGGVTWGEETVRVMVVGLGGGALPMFIRDHIPQVIQDVVEIDPKMVETAVEWFGFDYDSHMDPPANDTCINVIIDDAINYISSLAKTHTGGPLYHAIILDVDNKDDSTGITSPPIGFTTSEFLNSCHCLLHPNGIFVSNLAARNKEIDTAVINSVASCFPLVVRNYVAEHVNDVIVGFPVWRDDIASGGGLSHDGHVTNVAMATHLRSNSFSMSDVLRSHLESFSQCVYGKGNSELMECFNDSVLFASN